MKTLTYIFLVLISLAPIHAYCDEIEMSQDEVKRTFRFDVEEANEQEDCVTQRAYDKEDRFNTYRCNE